MIDLADDLDRPLASGIFVEPKDDGPASEFDRQRSFLAELRKSAPAVLALAIPNGSHDGDWTRIRKWKEGAVAGAPDLHLCWNHGSIWIEMKSGKGDLKPAQRDMLNRLHERGFRVAVVRKPATAIALLREAGAPFLWRETVR